jgi:N-acetylglucosamine kinase-like BadF-type ATPase
MGGNGLGRRALQAVFNADIGLGEKTVLTDCLLKYFGEDDLEKLLFKYKKNILTRPLKDISFLLFKVAKEGDSVSLKIIKDFATAISRYTAAGINKYKLSDKVIDVVLTGGIFKENFNLLEETISSEIHVVCPKANIYKARLKPVIGAVLSALDVIYKENIPLNILKNIDNSYKELKSENGAV